MRVYLFNDTSHEHAGCRAVMESIDLALAGHEVIARNRVGERFYDEAALRSADAVLVNGEGTLHHGAGGWLMDMLAHGQRLGKRTLLVNALFQQSAEFYPEVLRRLDFFSVREPQSFDAARLCGGYPELLLDSCVGASLENGITQPGVTGLVKGDTHPQSPVHGVLDRLPFKHLGLDGRFADFVATVRQCRVYVTGQHHAVYGCGLAGTPFVALPGNSHKIESLLEWSGLPIKVCTTLEEIEKQILFAKRNPEVFLRFQEFLRAHRCFNTSDVERVLGGSRANSRFWQGSGGPAAGQGRLIRNYDESTERKRVGATCFFRNRTLLRTVLEHVDPKRERINAFVHCCSIGCEPYSLAIAWKLFFGGGPAPELTIYAADLSPVFLEQARRAVYPKSIIYEMLPEEQAFFEPATENGVSPRADIRQMVRFLPPASFTEFDSPEECDVVFLLNALLYVSEEDQTRTIDRIALRNPGLLVLTGAHSGRLQGDMTRNHYLPVTDNLAAIYDGWADRRNLPPGHMVAGVTYHTPALEPIVECADADFRYCSIFRKRPMDVHLCPDDKLADSNLALVEK